MLLVILHLDDCLRRGIFVGGDISGSGTLDARKNVGGTCASRVSLCLRDTKVPSFVHQDTMLTTQ